jgi:deoxyribose-phosphate aldolase
MERLHAYLDHTLLKPDLKIQQVTEAAQLATHHQFAGLCIPPSYVKHAHEQLSGSKVKAVTVIGFPLGYQKISPKTEEAREALDDGADEIDMVMNVSAFKSGLTQYVQEDIDSITHLTHRHNKLIKVIIETGLLDEEEIRKTCSLCASSGVDYVKTCTGFNGGHANVDHVALMRESLPANTKIKASGGIKTVESAKALIDAGADRLGTSSSLNLIAYDAD